MIEKINSLDTIRRIAEHSDVGCERLELYLEIARISPGRLTMAIDGEGRFAIYKEQGAMAVNPAIFAEHFFLYRAGADTGVPARMEDCEAAEILGFFDAHYDEIWLSFDNLAPNQHVYDTPAHRYNRLALDGLTYEGWLTRLSANGRSSLRRALRGTEGAAEECLTRYEDMARFVEGPMREHYRARYGSASLLETALGLAETLLVARLRPAEIHIFRRDDEWSFVFFAEMAGSLCIVFIGGVGPAMIRRAYEAVINS